LLSAKNPTRTHAQLDELRAQIFNLANTASFAAPSGNENLVKLPVLKKAPI